MSHDRYLELLDQGYDPDQAARRSGYTPRGQKPPRVLVRPSAASEAWKAAGMTPRARKVTRAAVTTRVELPTVMPTPRPAVAKAPAPTAVERPTPPDLTDGLCRQVDAELWYPEKGGSARDAKLVCWRCPVRAACLDDALIRGDQYGIRGGYSAKQRRTMVPSAGAA